MNALVLMLCTVMPQTPVEEPEAVDVPLGTAIDLDGKLGEQEWQYAARHALGAEGELLLQHDDNFLYLGLRGNHPGWAHVYVFDGEKVSVHHASAALGTAIYVRDDVGQWQPTQRFPERDAWALRDPSLSPELRAQRQIHLAEKRWVASNSTMGGNVFEFVLIKRSVDGKRVRVAVAYVGETLEPLLWPARLSDACAQRELLAGTTPENLAFQPETWERLKFLKPAVEEAGAPK